MNIDSINNGIVIDHIRAGQAMKIYDFLDLGALDCAVAIIKNAASSKMGKKDIIKIDSELNVDLNALGYIDPSITINIIKDGVRVRKYHPTAKRTSTAVSTAKARRGSDAGSNLYCISMISGGQKIVSPAARFQARKSMIVFI